MTTDSSTNQPPPSRIRAADPSQQLWQQWRQGGCPDVQEFLDHTVPLTPAQLVVVLRVDQRERWHRGDRVRVEDYLAARPALESNADAVLDLVYSELVLREEAGEAVALEELLQRFPQYTPQLRRQYALHEVLASDSLIGFDATTQAQGKPSSRSPAAPPERIGKYLIVSALDSGGQATVYRALHPALGKEVAIKWSHKELPPDPEERDRLLAEGRVLAELNHPHLARVYDFDFHEDRPYLVLEYIPGRNLEQCARQQPFSPQQAAAVVARVARALAEAHRRGVIHQDIKPSNILLDTAGQPRLIDFGLARLQHAWSNDTPAFGSVLGTVQFMAPEQAQGAQHVIDPRCDIFALGGVLYYLLTGRVPFRGGDLYETLEKAARCQWDRDALKTAQVPPKLAAICARAMAARPADRYPRAEDLAADLEAFERGPRLRPWMLALASVFLLAALGLAGWFGGWWQRETGDLQREVKLFRSTLTVRVWRKDRYYHLVDVVPLRSGDEVRIETEVPAGYSVSLFLFNSAGQLKRLLVLAPGKTERTLRYPEQEDRSAPLTGRKGTEFVFVIGSRSGPVGLEAVRKVWGEKGRWATLPEASVLRLLPEKVAADQKGRDLGAPRDRPDPEGQVRRRLEELRQRLLRRFDYFEGVAFAHQ